MCDRYWLGLNPKAVVTTTIRFRFDGHSTEIRPRYDNSTTYFATVDLPVVLHAI